MKKCAKITVKISTKKGFLHDCVQFNARNLYLEGIARLDSEQQVSIIVCGTFEAIENFVDILHKEAYDYGASQIRVEPFIKEKDYRGIFRVIE